MTHHYSLDKKDIVLIHDGVRPMIDQETISKCLDCVRKNGNAITTTPAIETIFVNGEAGRVGEIFNRSQCAMARAPQCFYLQDIYAAHLKAQTEHRGDFIDSAMLMQRLWGNTLYGRWACRKYQDYNTDGLLSVPGFVGCERKFADCRFLRSV